MQIEIPSPRFYVRWSCNRCGHTGGYACTTVPIVAKDASEPMMRALFDALRVKLVKIHMRESVENGRACIPTPSNFVLERGVPEDATIAGLV